MGAMKIRQIMIHRITFLPKIRSIKSPDFAKNLFRQMSIFTDFPVR